MRRVDVARGPCACNLGLQCAYLALDGAVGTGFFACGGSWEAARRPGRALGAAESIHENFVAAVGGVVVIDGYVGRARSGGSRGQGSSAGREGFKKAWVGTLSRKFMMKWLVGVAYLNKYC